MNTVAAPVPTTGSLTRQLQDRIETALPEGLLRQYPIADSLALLDARPENCSYAHVTPAVARLAGSILEAGGESALSGYLQRVLVELMDRNRAKVDASDLPEAIKVLYRLNFARIADDIVHRRQEAGFYHPENDKFQKDIGVCSLRIIPAGVQKLNRHKLPLRLLGKGGVRKNFQFFSHVIGTLRGTGPLYDMHTDSHDADLLSRFNPEGWRAFYRDVAALLQVRTEVIGLFTVAWYFDAELANVSPRLRYLRELAIESGGRLFDVGPTDSAARARWPPPRTATGSSQKANTTRKMSSWSGTGIP